MRRHENTAGITDNPKARPVIHAQGEARKNERFRGGLEENRRGGGGSGLKQKKPDVGGSGKGGVGSKGLT